MKCRFAGTAVGRWQRAKKGFLPVLILLVLGQIAWGADGSPAARRTASDELFRTQVVPLVERCCLDCHSEDYAEAEVSFSGLVDAGRVLKDRDIWEKAFQLLRIDGMPPKDHDTRPSRSEREALVDWLDLKLHYVDCSQVDDPGRVTIRRLNRTEYNNTVCDLLGVELRPADDFSSDDVGYGFDNIGDVLSLPPLLLEKYVDASEKIAAAAIQIVPYAKRSVRFEGKQLGTTGSARLDDQGSFSLSSSGSVYYEHQVDVAGEYVIRSEAAADQAGGDLAKMEIRVDGKGVKVHEIKGHREWGTYEARWRLDRGAHRIEAAFINDFYDPKAENPRDRDRNLAVRFIELQGPMDVPPPQVHRQIVFVSPSDSISVRGAAEQIFQRLMPRAFRRPVEAAEVGRVVELVESVVQRGDSFERAIQVGLQAILVSPHFLFRIEYDSKPADPASHHAINDFELAARLSYFLWSTMPDAELFRLAEEGVLHEPSVLDAQVSRMLESEKANALVENFASQWLNLGYLDDVMPDPKLFPTFGGPLRADMATETQLLARSVFREDRSLLDFLDADYTFVNERLAKHYAIEGVTGERFQRVTLPANQRCGVLTHGSILTLTSNPDRTSLVQRGKWILDNVLGLELPDPPPNIPSLEEGAKKSGAKTLREQLKIHRDNPMCASCHDTLDPLGFGFENFDAIGRWRDQSEGRPVEASGTLPSGESFHGPIELVQILKKSKQDFAELVTRKMLTYALGRGLELPDSCAVDQIVAGLQENDYRFTVLVRGIVRSRPFLMRRGDSGVE